MEILLKIGFLGEMIVVYIGLDRGRGIRVAATCGLLLLMIFPIACMTTTRAERQAEEAGTRIATAYWQQQTGTTNTFDVSRPADALALRIALLALAQGEQGVVFPEIPGAEPELNSESMALRVTLSDALAIAARNDRRYQSLKEDVFFRALDVDYQQYLFETSFSGALLGLLKGDPEPDSVSGQAGVGFKRKFYNGAEMAGQLAFDVFSLLRDDWRSTSFVGDLTIAVPLLRGAGRQVVREPLTQAERNLEYALRNFERYRQTYAVSIAGSYYKVLEMWQMLSNARDNERRLIENSRRAVRMFDAGRMRRIEVDQATTDLLRAEELVIRSMQSYEAQLDAFKIALGLPPESQIELEERELHELTERFAGTLSSDTDELDELPDDDEDEVIERALESRHDLAVARLRLDDAIRGVAIAADALLPDLTLSGKAGFNRRRVTGGGKYRGGEDVEAGVRVGMPWSRRHERNAYRRQLIAVEQSERAVEEFEDGVKQAVRNGRRNLTASQASYRNQVKAMEVAELRVKSNNLYMQSGRSSMRDVLEAEGALLTARNALCKSVIEWRMSELELRRDIGVLDITDHGSWQEVDGVN